MAPVQSSCLIRKGINKNIIDLSYLCNLIPTHQSSRISTLSRSINKGSPISTDSCSFDLDARRKLPTCVGITIFPLIIAASTIRGRNTPQVQSSLNEARLDRRSTNKILLHL